MGDKMTRQKRILLAASKLRKKCYHLRSEQMADKITAGCNALVDAVAIGNAKSIEQRRDALQGIMERVKDRMNGNRIEKSRRQPPFLKKTLNPTRTKEGRQDRILAVLEHYQAFMTPKAIAEHTGDGKHMIELELPELLEDEMVIVEKFKQGAGVSSCNAYRIAKDEK